MSVIEEVLWCVACHRPFDHERTAGAKPQRCPPCRKARRQQTSREDKRRWQARKNLERAS